MEYYTKFTLCSEVGNMPYLPNNVVLFSLFFLKILKYAKRLLVEKPFFAIILYFLPMVENEPMTIAKIVSGGQTGVDRGALEASLKLSFPYGGMIPKGRKAEDGIIPLEFANMTESDFEDYRFRTRWNAEHSDATLILSFTSMLEGGKIGRAHV